MRALLFIGIFVFISFGAQAGEALYATCAACHGDKGQGNPAMNGPSLTGQSAGYLAQQLQNFKAGIRGADTRDVMGAQMAAMSNVLVDAAAIQSVSEYIANLPLTSVNTNVAGVKGDPVIGKNVYIATCAACHGRKGEGNPSMSAPRLAGLDEAYFVRQLKNYRDGVRGMHERDVLGRQMRMMSQALKDETNIKNVITYLHSVQP